MLVLWLGKEGEGEGGRGEGDVYYCMMWNEVMEIVEYVGICGVWRDISSYRLERFCMYAYGLDGNAERICRLTSQKPSSAHPAEQYIPKPGVPRCPAVAQYQLVISKKI